MKPALLLALLLPACATIDLETPPPVGWPKLEERVVYGFAATQKCAGAFFPFTIAAGCAHIHLGDMTCTLHFPSENVSPGTMAHERGHCMGYDHPGGTTIRDLWERYKVWKARGEK